MRPDVCGTAVSASVSEKSRSPLTASMTENPCPKKPPFAA